VAGADLILDDRKSALSLAPRTKFQPDIPRFPRTKSQEPNSNPTSSLEFGSWNLVLPFVDAACPESSSLIARLHGGRGEIVIGLCGLGNGDRMICGHADNSLKNSVSVFGRPAPTAGHFVGFVAGVKLGVKEKMSENTK